MAPKTHLDRLKNDLQKTAPKRYGQSLWGERHVAAFKDSGALLLLAGDEEVTEEQAFIFMLAGWLAYADAHQERCESPIGSDGVLGPCWKEIGESLHGLLDGDMGRLDANTIDRFIAQALEREKFKR
jgi:hypothetical protein